MIHGSFFIGAHLLMSKSVSVPVSMGRPCLDAGVGARSCPKFLSSRPTVPVSVPESVPRSVTILFQSIVDSGSVPNLVIRNGVTKWIQFHALAQEAITRFEGRYKKVWAMDLSNLRRSYQGNQDSDFEIKVIVRIVRTSVRTGLRRRNRASS